MPIGRRRAFADEAAAVDGQTNAQARSAERLGKPIGFVRIVEFLQSKGCRFMTPSEYLKSIEKAKG